MGNLIVDLLEPLFEAAGEWLLLQLCDLIVAGWHALQTLLSQALF